MRFIEPDTRTIDLAPQNGERQYIEVKCYLSKGEDATYRTRGFKRMRQTFEGNAKDAKPKEGDGANAGAADIEIDWKAMSLGRVEAYLVGWSAKDKKGRPVPVSASAIAALDVNDFEEIDQAILKHIGEMDEAKKQTAGTTTSTATSV